MLHCVTSVRTVRYTGENTEQRDLFYLAEISVMVSWGDQSWTEASQQDSILHRKKQHKSGNQRYNITLMHLPKHGSHLQGVAARNLNPRQEQWESYVEFIQKGRRITELGGNFLGTSL